MIFFRNDYGQGCVESVMELLKEANEESNPGYGDDSYSRKACDILQSKLPDVPSDIHFIVSGTLANLTMVRHVLKPYEAVIACDTAHIVVHEAGAIEATGHKVIVVPHSNGKMTVGALRRTVQAIREENNYFMDPKLVYISNATEMGTVYSRKELEDLSAYCKENHMYLMIDGARMGAALMSGIDYSLNDIAKWSDIFTVGGTKNGALFGEAVVISNPVLKPYFRFIQKQSGAILAKGWLLALQFIGLFESDDFYKCAGHANAMAKQIQDEVIALGYPLYMKSTTNLTFVVLNKVQYDYLSQRVDFEVWGRWDDDYIIRLVSSWHTTQDEVDYLKVYLNEAMELSKRSQLEALAEAEEDASIQDPFPPRPAK